MSWNNSMNGMTWRMIQATEKLVVGETYYLAVQDDKVGAMVKVHAKSTEKNASGWPSSIDVEVLEFIGQPRPCTNDKTDYAVGARFICNALNLFKTRAEAKPRFYRGRRVA